MQSNTNMVSPFAAHQQQLAMLAQQQSLLMAAAAKSGGHMPAIPGNVQQPGPNGNGVPSQNWPNFGYQIPGMIPAAGIMQVNILIISLVFGAT